MTIEEIKNLIIKLDVNIEAEHENVSAEGIMLLMNFTEEVRKKQVIEALAALTKIEQILQLE